MFGRSHKPNPRAKARDHYRAILGAAALLMSPLVVAQDQIPDLERSLKRTSGLEKARVFESLMDEYAGEEPQKVLAYGRQALTLLEQHPDRDLACDVKLKMSGASFRLGDLAVSLKYAQESAAMSQELGNRALHSAATNIMGSIFASRGEYDRALAFFGQTLETKRYLEQKDGVAGALRNMAIVYQRMGDLDRALEHSLEAVRILRGLGLEEQIAGTYNSISSIYRDLGSNDIALDYLLKALDIYEKLDKRLSMAPILNNIGGLQLAMGKHERALAYLNRSLKIKEEVGTKSGVAFSIEAIGAVYLKMNEYDKAREYFLRALRLFEEVGEKAGTTQTHVALADLYLQSGRLDESLVHVQQVLKLADESQAKSQLSHGYQLLAKIQEAKGDHRRAFDSLKKFKETHDEVINEETSMNIARLEARYEADQKAKEIALLKKDNEIQALEVARQKLLRNSWVLGTIGAAVLIGLAAFIENRRTQQKRLEKMVEERTQALMEIQAQMVETAHRAGMAEIAIDVLHNVGNSLNSVHASAGMLLENLHNTKPMKILEGIVDLLEKHQTSLEDFLSEDSRGKAIPEALARINDGLNQRQERLIGEVVQLKEGLNAVNDLIKAQDRYVNVADSGEEIDLTALMEKQIQDKQGILHDHGIELNTDFAQLPRIFTQKYKVNRVLGILLDHAIDAVKATAQDDRKITIKAGPLEDHWLQLVIEDNGKGISKQDLEHIFAQGYGTNRKGAVIDLHFCATAMMELGGRIHAESDGPGRGTRMILTLPKTQTPDFEKSA